MSELLNKNEEISELLDSLSIYYTSRIDMKNFGNETNNIEIIDILDSDADITFPKWFKNNSGTGVIIQSNALSIDLKIKCVNNGKLEINLRGLDIRDKETNRFPVYIDYTSLIINNKEYIKTSELAWHDESFKVEKEVKDNELITIHAEWKPFNSSSLYENKAINKLKEKNDKLIAQNKKQKEKIKELKDENNKLKKQIKKISNSSLWEIRKIKKEL